MQATDERYRCGLKGGGGVCLRIDRGLETLGTFIVENYDSIRFASFHALHLEKVSITGVRGAG